MARNPPLAPPASNKLLAVAPLALLLVLIPVGMWAGRDQLENAIEASGSFIKAQVFGTPAKAAGGWAAIDQKIPANPAASAEKAKPAASGDKAAEATGDKAAADKEAADKAAADKAAADKAAADKAAADKAAAEKAAADKAAADKATAEKAAADKAAADKAAQGAAPKVVVEVEDKGRKLQIMDVPIPADCHPQQNADFGGDAVVWGLGHKKASALECCAACKQHQAENPGRPCNVWVWCGDPSGVCWTMDIHNHTTGDCWLKHQAKWDNNPDLSKSNLEINHKGAFTAEFRAVHKSAPELVPWVAGVIPAKPKARRMLN